LGSSLSRYINSLRGEEINEIDIAEECSIPTSDSYSYLQLNKNNKNKRIQAACTLRLTPHPLQPAAMAFVSFGFV
jgi:hypothetical protein